MRPNGFKGLVVLERGGREMSEHMQWLAEQLGRHCEAFKREAGYLREPPAEWSMERYTPPHNTKVMVALLMRVGAIHAFASCIGDEADVFTEITTEASEHLHGAFLPNLPEEPAPKPAARRARRAAP